jgi:hypothetical protein
MKGLKVFTYLLGAAILGVGIAMAITNPRQDAYNRYATQQLTAYLESNVCSEAPQVLGNLLVDQCVSLLRNNQTELAEIVAQSTQRQNFGILSIYKTNLSASQFIPPVISDSVPSYHFETLGVFQNFYTFKAEEQRQGN